MDPRSFSATRWLFAMLGQWINQRFQGRFPRKSAGAGILIGVLTFIAVMNEQYSVPMWDQLLATLS